MKAQRQVATALLIALALTSLGSCRGREAATPEETKARNQALARERDELKSRLGELVANDRRLAGLPQNGVRVGVPTSLARNLVQRVLGGLILTTTARQILASPKFPVVKVKLKPVPSPESWAAVQKILDDKSGVCGFVLDKVDIAGVLDRLISKGFDVRLPTEKIKPMAVPVGIAPTMTVRGEPVTIQVKVGSLAITEYMIWLGADVALGMASEAPKP